METNKIQSINEVSNKTSIQMNINKNYILFLLESRLVLLKSLKKKINIQFPELLPKNLKLQYPVFGHFNMLYNHLQIQKHE